MSSPALARARCCWLATMNRRSTVMASAGGGGGWRRLRGQSRVCCEVQHPKNNKVRRMSATPILQSGTTALSLLASSNSPAMIQIDDRVKDAIEHSRPVVALESTIIAHGMPYPDNFELSQRLASLLHSRGVEPATIAMKDGICRVGLTVDELHDLAQAGDQGRAEKCSTRDLALLMASQHEQQRLRNNNSSSNSNNPDSQWGATTVASTMVIAHAAGISTFVSGGIGGVHRYGETTMDISADLIELSRTPVIVVTAGVKSILDIERTVEVLETYSVPTIAYQTDEFPAFFSPHSGVPAPARVDDVSQIAEAYHLSRDLGLSHGYLVAVPNNDPASGAGIEDAIQKALQEATDQGITGKSVTPYVLKRVSEMTGGESLRSNISLVEQNARVGCDIAIAVAERQRTTTRPRHSVLASERPPTPATRISDPVPSRVIVMGGSVTDIVAKPLASGQDIIMGTSNPATVLESFGGVGRNVTEVLGRLGSKPLLYSSVGNDSRGRALLEHLETDLGVAMPRSTIPVVDGQNTATYMAILNGANDLHTACADMSVLTQIPPPPSHILEAADVLVLDANPPLELLRKTATQANQAAVKVVFDPTSVPKCLRLARDDQFMSCLTYALPNLDELAVMADGWDTTEEDLETLGPRSHGDFEPVKLLATQVLERMNPNESYLVITLGSQGVLLACKEGGIDQPTFVHLPGAEIKEVANSTGAGDTLTGAFVHAILNGKSAKTATEFAMTAAVLSLRCSESAVSPLVSGLILE